MAGFQFSVLSFQFSTGIGRLKMGGRESMAEN
jgi:hypothetical protein